MGTNEFEILLVNAPAGYKNADITATGISRVMEGLDPSLGGAITFLDLEYLNLPMQEIERRFVAHSPQVIAFSACLTHSYKFVKTVSLMARKALPRAVQVLGGQMAVAANILLQRTAIDFCVMGESEPAFSALLKRLKEKGFSAGDKSRFRDIRGLAFLLDSVPFFTGYADDARCEVRQINYSLIGKYTDLDYYLQGVEGDFYSMRIGPAELRYFSGLLYPENRKRRIAKVYASKGCVNKCTFCHRFYPGYRALEPREVTACIERLRSEHSVGLIQFGDENFGTHREKTLEILDYLRKTRLNWSACCKAKTIDQETARLWKEAGCVSVSLGIESGSQRMLEVMEKRTLVEENLSALRALNEQGLYSGVGLVLGMPGESLSTVRETVQNLGSVLPDDIFSPYEICINWFQAVPGTPGYEFARKLGLIDDTLDGEERYLEGLYGVNANDLRHYLNFTDLEKEEIAYWKEYITMELLALYVKKHGALRVFGHKQGKRYKAAVFYGILPEPVRRSVLKYAVMVKAFGPLSPLRLWFKKAFKIRPAFFASIDSSLRQVTEGLPEKIRPDDVHTHILRKGR